MRLPLVSCAVLLTALPADGTTALLPPPVFQALTLIDAVPSKDALDDAFGRQAPFDNLLSVALDRTIDLGIELRAIRALPAYCPLAPQICGAGSPAHDALVALVASQSSPGTPPDLLRLRAAAEALGATHSGLLDDATQLMSLLGNASRDVRATAIRAIRQVCNSDAIPPLKSYLPRESSPQVRIAITAAVQDLGLCPH